MNIKVQIHLFEYHDHIKQVWILEKTINVSKKIISTILKKY